MARNTTASDIETNKNSFNNLRFVRSLRDGADIDIPCIVSHSLIKEREYDSMWGWKKSL